MEIDINQLPIPHWNIRCPKCGYPLAGLPSHRCPECGTVFEMSDLVETWTRLRHPRFTGRELPVPDFGLRCPGCDTPTAGWTTHTCPACSRRCALEDWLPDAEWFVVDEALAGDVPLTVLEAALAMEYVPYVHQKDKLAREIVMGPRSHGMPLRVPREFFFDVCWLIQRARREMERAQQGDAPPWRCSNCGEQVPAHFDLCWNCQHRHR